jgi:hypothetical protein
MRFWLIFAAFVIAVLGNLGCATSIATQYPHLDRRSVCLRVPGIENEAADWIYDDNGNPVSGEHTLVIDRIASTARTVYEFVPDADPNSVQHLPPQHQHLQCTERFSVLPPKEDKEWLPEETVFFADEPLRQRAAEERGCPPQVAAAYLGDVTDPPKTYVKDKCMAPKAVSAREETIRAARGAGEHLGRQYGAAFGELKKTIALLPTMGPGIGLQHFLKTRPDFVLELLTGLNKHLDAIPDLPLYDDEELAKAAFQGFQQGFGNQMAQAQIEGLALFGVFEMVHIAVTAGASLVEAPAARAFEATFARLRRIPIFIPGTVGGAGFFLRVQKTLPKPPPANVNAPSVPPGVVPPVSALPPFGKLSRAAEFGIQSYNQMLNALKGTGLSAHHLIEQRLKDFMRGDPRLNLTVAVTDAEHQVFTNAWRKAFPYGNTGAIPITEKAVLEAAREIYKDHPAILKALNL